MKISKIQKAILALMLAFLFIFVAIVSVRTGTTMNAKAANIDGNYYLDIDNKGWKDGAWQIEVTNNSSARIEVVYNTNMCFYGDAERWEGLKDPDHYFLDAGASHILPVYGNGSGTSVAFSYIANDLRLITFADGLHEDKSISVHHSSMPYLSSCLVLRIVGKNGHFWTIEVKNPNDYQVQVVYNEKMCYDGDAREWKGLKHTNEVTLNKDESAQVEIQENWSANAIAFSYVKEHTRYITYAYNLNTNTTMTVRTLTKYAQ